MTIYNFNKEKRKIESAQPYSLSLRFILDSLEEDSSPDTRLTFEGSSLKAACRVDQGVLKVRLFPSDPERPLFIASGSRSKRFRYDPRTDEYSFILQQGNDVDSLWGELSYLMVPRETQKGA